jgi:hypothetical protein
MNNVVSLCVVNWRVLGVIGQGRAAPVVIRDPPPLPLPVGLRATTV